MSKSVRGNGTTQAPIAPQALRKRPGEPRKKRKGNTFLFILSRIGLWMLMLIPMALAFTSYALVKNAPVETVETYYIALDLEGPTGTKVTVLPSGSADQSTEASTLFDGFSQMLSGAVYTPGVPETHTGRYKVTMRTNNGEEHYIFHFSTADGAAYYTTENGTNYRTADGRAESFLNSSYAFELYAQSTPPVLTSAATDIIVPSALSWSYQTKDGTFAELTQLPTTPELLTYPIANDVAFEFSLPPSVCKLTIRNGDRVLHTGESVSSISLPASELTQGSVLDFEIETVYQQDSRYRYYGSAFYRFRMVVVEAAEFFLNGVPADLATVHTATQGSYLLLSCQNVRNEQNLVISATPALSAPPVIFKRGDMVYAAIPADTVGSRRLTATYGTISSHFDLNITPNASAASHEALLLRGDWDGALNGGLLAAYIAGHGANADSAFPYKFTPNGLFAAPVKVADRRIAFGDTVTSSPNNLNAASLPFELYATQDAICAMAGGYVADVVLGDALLGNYVVLDHGGGLYTWYCGLKQIDVTEGFSVAKGQRLGAAGQTGLGLADTDCALVLATWGKTAVSPQFLREYDPNLKTQ